MSSMDNPAFSPGQPVTINRLYGPDAWVEKELQSCFGRTGTILRVWCRTREEMPELSKMFTYPDVWCYDVRLEDGTVVPGIPEALSLIHI